ncbi:YdeI/OmpD-associated family protein [Adhaeribacter rhizoryzae]|uniref:YdhG-like domain-containing protein n=1 Tax=Adhaeribacter rhizoryzae TaxID=2607907 RepID=A0A5M6DPT5_9BACT|nr:DUF1801 domain-containing protein [Adhaeribacter rhizoryzae]KAA5548252.1 hypothetical protein F0145_05865 [Adhaeribacter rhizoryzae]
MNPEVDMFLSKAKKWREEMFLLREIVLDCKLNEQIKWMHPCYTYQNNNIVLIHGFKDYCALLFFKGVLITDKAGLLIQQTENVQDRRQMRFTSLDDIVKLKTLIKDYVKEAIKIEQSGVKVAFKNTAEFNRPEEFEKLLQTDKEIELAFNSLTPGRQRGYLLYFSAAKQPKTRESRIEKYIPKILAGKGLDD